jgi:dTDP-4-amino-4,6-dideoxygalactose transaminase
VSEQQKSSWHLFVIQTDHRTELIEKLALDGVETLIHYPTPCHLQDAYREKKLFLTRRGLKDSERLSKRILSLPMDPLMSEGEVDQVIGSVNRFSVSRNRD